MKGRRDEDSEGGRKLEQRETGKEGRRERVNEGGIAKE